MKLIGLIDAKLAPVHKTITSYISLDTISISMDMNHLHYYQLATTRSCKIEEKITQMSDLCRGLLKGSTKGQQLRGFSTQQQRSAGSRQKGTGHDGKVPNCSVNSP